MREPRDATHPAVSERFITVLGVVLAVAAGVALPLLADTPNAKTEVILGLIGFVAAYLLTMDVATRVRLREMETRILERLDQVEEARFGALPLQRLLTVPDIEEAVRDVVTAAADARAKRMQFLANRTIERIKSDRDETLRISQGIFRCVDRREELRLLRYALSDSRDSLKAVAGLGLAHWRTPEFAEYLDTYLEFADSIEQTRIFLTTPEEMQDPVMLEVLRHHQRSGAQTFALDKTALPPELLRPLVLFDDELLLVHSAGSGGEVEVHFTDDPLRVRDARENFDALMRRISRRRGSTLLWSPSDLAVPADLAPNGEPPAPAEAAGRAPLA